MFFLWSSPIDQNKSSPVDRGLTGDTPVKELFDRSKQRSSPIDQNKSSPVDRGLTGDTPVKELFDRSKQRSSPIDQTKELSSGLGDTPRKRALQWIGG